MADHLFELGADERRRQAAVAGGRFVKVALERGIERAGRGGPGKPGGAGFPARPGRAQLDAGFPARPGPSIDGTLTYAAGDLPLTVGDRVRVPLGRGDKPADGVVVRVGGAELLDGLSAAKVKAVLGPAKGTRAGSGAALPASLLPLAEWLAQYYVCPLGMVLGAMVPAAVKRETGARRVEYVEPARENAGAIDALPPRLRKVWGLIEAAGVAWPVTAKELAASVRGVSRPAVRKLVDASVLVAGERKEVRARGLDGEPAADEEPSADVSSTAGAIKRAAPLALTDDQARAETAIAAGLERFGVHVLLGVTGSGKTEVYLRVLERVLAAGASGIVLVPEIALTPQTAGRFTGRFGAGRVAVLHSGLTAAQRHAQWRAVARGDVRVVVGARSAVFAPLPGRLGLIVVDEEHDSSYKQDQLPRYHARDVAIKRAQLAGCPVILGSATPALETYANAVSGKFALHRLMTRATGAAMPKVEIVDLTDEQRERASGAMGLDRYVHLLGPRLERALDAALTEGHQAILLLNRRGYANYISCPDQRCGWVMPCTDCDATMVYHKALLGRPAGHGPGVVRCHHCLAEQLLPALCPVCGKKVNTFGEGTQRLEEELERKFAVPHGLVTGRTLLRLDSDTMRTGRDYFAALDAFARGTVRVLVGTQMIAKGLDFPGVRLVGVVNADTALSLPDFRSSERTYQLVSQVAGRAGRGGGSGGDSGSPPVVGRVIVQTRSPHAAAIRLAAQHDFETFAREELATRRRAGLPPATRMARIVCRDEDATKAMKAASEVAAALRAAAEEAGLPANALTLRGPMPCPFARIARHHRVEIQLTAASRGVIQSLLQAVRGKGLLKSDAHTAVDVDPVALL